MTKEPVSVGTPMAIGLVPSSALPPPKGCTSASLVVRMMQTSPVCAMASAYQASMPIWLLLAIAATAMPVWRARALTTSTACMATTGPSPCCPSTLRKLSPRQCCTPRVAGSATPLPMRAMIRSSRKKPCDGSPAVPRRAADPLAAAPARCPPRRPGAPPAPPPCTHQPKPAPSTNPIRYRILTVHADARHVNVPAGPIAPRARPILSPDRRTLELPLRKNPGHARGPCVDFRQVLIRYQPHPLADATTGSRFLANGQISRTAYRRRRVAG